MKATIRVAYWEKYLPTPRHRKLRAREIAGQFEVGIPSVGAAEAPVAIVQRGWLPHAFEERFEGGQTLEYRWWGGRLWARPLLSDYVARPEPNRHATLKDALAYPRLPYGAREDAEEARRAAEKWASNHLLVDGALHVPIGEPMYVVMTFGLGHNHGGTSLSVDNHYNSNLHRDRYFRADELEAALREAERIAAARGDTDDIPQRPDTTLEVILPEALTRNPAADHGTGDPFLNRMYALSESGAPPAIVALVGIAEALKPDAAARAPADDDDEGAAA